MAREPDKLKELSKRLDKVIHQQEVLQAEIRALRREISGLPLSEESVAEETPEAEPVEMQAGQPTAPAAKRAATPGRRFSLPRRTGLDWEKFIGENLISKIGILITVIGVAFGVKYAIDRDLISPLTRIMLAYLAGGGLLFLAVRLKARYESFSAVLLSGALAILYIVTYFAYSYYALFPAWISFVLMVLFTGSAVPAAWIYDRQIIALMGLVGAYGVPYLISEDSGSAEVLLGYMSLINTGILIIALRKYWKALFNTAFWLSWFIFGWWLAFGFRADEDFATGMFFSLVFFGLFYATALAYKLYHREAFKSGDILTLLTNASLYFLFGLWMLAERDGGDRWFGLFALLNALIHAALGALIRYRSPETDRRLVHFLFGLGLVLLAVAIPLQLDGRWVTILWAGQAALLFWMARSRPAGTYEKLVLGLLVFAFGSLVHDWAVAYGRSLTFSEDTWLRPLFNRQLPQSLFFCGIIGVMLWIQQAERFRSELPAGNWWRQGLRFLIPATLILSLYYAFRMEVEYYWRLEEHVQLYVNEAAPPEKTYLYEHLKVVWVVYYSLFFLILLSWANIRRVQDRLLGWANLALNLIAVLAFLALGQYSLSEVRELSRGADAAASLAAGYDYLRYLGYLLLAALLWTTYRYQRSGFLQLTARWPFDALLYISAWWAASSELIHWLALSGSEDAYKLGLSILWGIYSLFLIGMGIAQRKAYLRVSAIVLFAITLVKLFFYDITHLNTVSKTIVLVSLGVLLLVSSFLYNRFRDLIVED